MPFTVSDRQFYMTEKINKTLCLVLKCGYRRTNAPFFVNSVNNLNMVFVSFCNKNYFWKYFSVNNLPAMHSPTDKLQWT